MIKFILLFYFIIVCYTQPVIFTNDCFFTQPWNYYYRGVSVIGANMIVQNPAGYPDLQIGQVVMILQMQGGTIYTNNSPAYGGNRGDGKGYNTTNAGRYEFAIITSVSTNGPNITISFYDPLKYIYEINSLNDRVQVVTVPFCYNTTITSPIGRNDWKSWDGEIGGVVSLLTIRFTLTASLDLSGIGFRGGPDFTETFNSVIGKNSFADTSADDPNVANYNAIKGEGFIGSPRFPSPINTATTYPGGLDCARGSPGSAGGGGNGHDRGAGGGSNIGYGTDGGNTRANGGGGEVGFGALGYSNINPIDRLFLGGGGGAGAGNSNHPPGQLRGLSGGGIFYLHARDYVSIENGTSIISSSEPLPSQSGFPDGGGGAGAGGSIVLLHDMNSSSFNNLLVAAEGGTGVRGGPGDGGCGGGGLYATTSSTGGSVSGGIARIHSVPDTQIADGGNGAIFLSQNSTIYNSYPIFARAPPSQSNTPTPTKTPSITPTPSKTITPTGTISKTPTATLTPTSSISESFTPTSSISESFTPTSTLSSSLSQTASVSLTRTSSSTKTPKPTISRTTSTTPSSTRSKTATMSVSITISPTMSISLSISISPAGISASSSLVINESENIQEPILQSNLNSNSNSNTLSRSLSPTKSLLQSIGNTKSRSACIDCEQVNVLNLAIDVTVPEIPIISSSGENVANIIIPTETEAQLPLGSSIEIESIPLNVLPEGSIVSSTVLSVLLFDSNQNEISLTGTVELCFTSDILENLEDGCLGFVNDNNEWECEDPCLTSNDEGQICGETDHFTNFAILFSGSEGGCNGDSQSNIDYIITYLSISSIGIAIIIIIIAIIIIEIKYLAKSIYIRNRLQRFGYLSRNFHNSIIM